MLDRKDANHMADRPAASFAGKIRKDESGQGLVEYALMLLLVALVTIAALELLGTNLGDALQSAADVFP